MWSLQCINVPAAVPQSVSASVHQSVASVRQSVSRSDRQSIRPSVPPIGCGLHQSSRAGEMIPEVEELGLGILEEKGSKCFKGPKTTNATMAIGNC